jgi:Domain of unknown function (DUF4249)
MQRRMLRGLSFFAGMLIVTSCLDTFNPPMDLRTVDVLVIDGFLNASEKRVDVVITQAQTLTSAGPAPVVSGASVSIHSADGGSFNLPETKAGTYSRTELNIDHDAKYQLRVKTLAGEEYHSDFVDVRRAPSIRDLIIEPRQDETALEVTISAADPTKNTRYYRWDYIETWEYTSIFRSDFDLVNRLPVPRLPGQGIYRCYRQRQSTKILVGTTIHLDEDVVSNQLLATIPKGDQRTMAKYGIEVIQRSITRHEYDYLRQLQKSTESLGGLFDPQPSQTYGNIQNIGDSSIPVLGYFSAGTTNRLRSFYIHDDLPEAMKVLPPIGSCVQDTVCLTIPNSFGLKCHIELKTLKGTEVITGSLFKEFETIGFMASTAECADCRTQGGTTTPPPFW